MPYHRNNELLRQVETLVHQAGQGASMIEIGQTVEGRSIIAAEITKGAKEGNPGTRRPQVFVSGNIHGQEVIGSEVALGVLALLCAEERERAATELLDLADVTVIPAVNLDSRSLAINDYLDGKVRGNAPRGNSHSVDLNRNFPIPEEAKDVWYPTSGTSIAWLPWYRGPEPLSEPESRSLAELAERKRPVGMINFHSVGRYFLHPYSCTSQEPAEIEDFRAMGEAYISSQPYRRYRVRQGRSWYTILGGIDDYLYHQYGTLSVIVEVSSPLCGVGWNPLRLLKPFAFMNPIDPEPTVLNNAEACLVALAEAVRLRQARNRAEGKVVPGDATIC